jgi:hypothetical protein
MADDSLLAYGTIALAIATAVLVYFTYYYAKQTRNTVIEMKRNTESNFRPYLEPRLGGVISREAGLLITIIIRNVGKGPAMQIRTRISVNETPTIMQDYYNIPTLEEKTDHTIKFNAGHQESLSSQRILTAVDYMGSYSNARKTTTLNLEFNFKDIFDKPFTYSKTLDATNA